MIFYKYDIILEAPKKIKIKPDKNSTDYTEDTNAQDTADLTELADDADNEEDDQTDDGESNDYTEEETDVDPNEDPEEGSDDGSEDSDESETTDYSEDSPDESEDMDGSADSENSEQNQTDTTEKNKSLALMRDYIELYNSIKSNIEKVSSVKRGNLTIATIIHQVVRNLTKLEEVVFQYIYGDFKNRKYVENLYQYYSFIQALKINIQMLKKIKYLDIG